MHTEKTRLQHQIWPQKRGQFSDPQFVPFPIEGWFWGPLVGLGNGPRNSVFFLLLLPYHLGLNIWPAWPQLQRFSACQSGFTTKGSTCSKCPCTIIIICDQHSYYDCKHTHTCIYYKYLVAHGSYIVTIVSQLGYFTLFRGLISTNLLGFIILRIKIVNGQGLVLIIIVKVCCHPTYSG